MKTKLALFFKKNLNSFLLSLYLGTVIIIQLFTLIPADFFSSFIVKAGFFIIILVIYCLSYFISAFIIKNIGRIKIKNHPLLPRNSRYKLFLLFFIISLFVSTIWLLAYYPGGFSSDSISQYTQSLTNNYSDWHPVLHTIIIFKLPMLIFNNNATAIVICQILLFSLILSYALVTIYEIAGKKWSILSAILILANPMVMDELMSPWKDVAFGIITLLITTITLKIYLSPNSWCNKNSRIIILAILISLATLFRHNAILFTLPLVASLFFFLKRSHWIKLLVSILVIIFLIKIPLYSALQVTSPDNRITETTGLPLTVIGNAVKQTPNIIDANIIDFAHNIAPQEKWENQYVTGDFNSIKWHSNLSPVEEAGVFKVLEYSFRAITESPIAGLNGLFKATQVVYNLEKTDITYAVTPSIAENDYGISYGGNSTVQSAVNLYRSFFSHSILHYFTIVGTTVILIIAFILGQNQWRNKGWQRILLCSPILFYDFGTMLLLTSPETRFFYINFLIYPLIVIISSTVNRSTPYPKRCSTKTPRSIKTHSIK